MGFDSGFKGLKTLQGNWQCAKRLYIYIYIYIYDVYVTVHCVKFLIIKPIRCTNFSNLFLEWNSTCFGQFFCPSSGVFHCTHSNAICHTGLLTACEQDRNGTQCVQWKTPADGQRNCPKHVGSHSKNKFEKLVHLVGFIIIHTHTHTHTHIYIYIYLLPCGSAKLCPVFCN